MSPVAWQLDQLEGKIDKLRHEYDLFFSGNRRTAPIVLRDEVEREILRLTRDPSSSTSVQFRLRTLAHRFQALDGQVRQRIEGAPRRSGRAAAERRKPEDDASVFLDEAALANPVAVRAHLQRIHRAVSGSKGLDGKDVTLERLQARLLKEAAGQLRRPGVRGVQFKVVQGAEGARIRGVVMEESDGPKE